MGSKIKLNLADNTLSQEINTLVTNITELSLESNINTIINELEDDKLYSIIFDMDNDEELRINALNRYNEINQEYVIEIINRLNSMYIFSYTKILQKYLTAVIYKSKIDPVLKLESAKVLINNTDEGYDCINYICKTYILMPTPSRVDAILNLMKCQKYKSESLRYFIDFSNDKTVDNFYRYKCILGLEHTLTSDNLSEFIIPILQKFIENENNLIRIRILACQYGIKIDELITLCINTLFSFANDANLDYNLRGDSVDVLLHHNDDNIIQQARNILLELAREGKVMRTIYDNAQNVHSESIEDSAISILEIISDSCHKITTTFDDVRNSILSIIEKDDYDKTKREKIEMALTRIYLDRGVYGKFNITLIGILCRVWNFIITHEHSEEMKNRLIDELYDASDVCSTGYAFRILNTLSGFTDFSIKISFEDQIVSNLQGRLNARIRMIKDTNYMYKIIEEMTIDTHHYNLRSNFLKFFRENIPSIRQEMYEEFCNYMEDTDYDLYFRKAIFKYEGIE